VAFFSQEDPDASEGFRKIFGPDQVDLMVRQAIQTCWMMLPDEKRSADEVDRQIRRIVDRALRDLRDDFESFGMGKANG
jgi:hypothetical protein